MFGRFSVWILVLIAGAPEGLVAVVTDGLWTASRDHAPAGRAPGVSPGRAPGYRCRSGPRNRFDRLSKLLAFARVARGRETQIGQDGHGPGPAGRRGASRGRRSMVRRHGPASVTDPGRPAPLTCTGSGNARVGRPQPGITISGVSNPVLLVYSHRPEVRERIMTAIGRRPAPDVGRVDYLECSAVYEVMMATQAQTADVLILDGEAQPTGRHRHQPADPPGGRGGPAGGDRRPTGRRPLARHLGGGRRNSGPPARPGDGRRLHRGRAASAAAAGLVPAVTDPRVR